MAHALIRIRAGNPVRCEWWRPDGEAPTTGHGDLAAAAAAIGRQPVRLLVPGAWVTLMHAAVRARSERQLRQAVPYALEDRLAEEVEALHFALGPRDAQGVMVAVMERHRLEQLREAWMAHGLNVVSAVPEPLALPWQGTEWAVLIEDEIARVRDGFGSGFAVEADQLPLLLGLGLQQAETPPAAVRLYHRLEATVPELAELAAQGPELHWEALPEISITAWFGGQAAGAPLELLQGEFAPRSEVADQWRPWRATAVLAGLIVALGLVDLSLERLQVQREIEALRAERAAILQETFPDVQRVINPRVQMRNRLESLRQGPDPVETGVLDLLARAGEPLMTESQVRVEYLNWRNRRLELNLRANDLQTLDGLAGRIDTLEGITATLQSASSEGDQVQGRLRLQEADS